MQKEPQEHLELFAQFTAETIGRDAQGPGGTATKFNRLRPLLMQEDLGGQLLPPSFRIWDEWTELPNGDVDAVPSVEMWAFFRAWCRSYGHDPDVVAPLGGWDEVREQWKQARRLAA